jgi:hypothetical protein
MSTPRQAAWILGGLYALALLGSGVAVARRGAAPWTVRTKAEWVAARDLAPPEQLDSADLAAPIDTTRKHRRDRAAPGDTTRKDLPDRATLVGKHLVKPLRKGEPVTSVDVAPFSMGTPRAGTARFVLAARADQLPALALARPGEALSPCIAAGTPPAWDCKGPPFTVVSLHRTARADSVWAVLESADADLAARFAAAPSRMLLRRP